MKVTVIEPPEPVVTIEEARRQIVDLPSEDETLVESFIAAATAWIDGPAGWLGRCIGRQTIEAVGWFGCERTKLPFPPVVEIISITTEDASGNESAVDDNGYRFSRGDLVVSAGLNWVRQPVHRVRYIAGYESVPEPIKVAILMLVAHWYRSRGAVTLADAPQELPFGVEALLRPFRVYSF